MTLTQLHIFALVAELRSFTAAATALGISQSAVSHALKGLERELGVELLARSHSAIELTDIGSRLLLRTREMLGLAEAMRQDAADSRGLRQGTLRIGSFGPTSSLKLLPELLATYRSRYPDIEIYVDEGTDSEVVQWLNESRVDVGFTVLPDPRFTTVPLHEDQFVALIPSSEPVARRHAVSLNDLSALPFIMSEAGSGGLITGMFDAAGLKPMVRYRIAQLTSILGMVESGNGVSIVAQLSLPALAQEMYKGVAIRPLTPAVKRRIGLAVRDRQRLTPAADAFLEVAKELARARRAGR
jgi:DNA-binding transcriptional LysR family regulator